MSDAFDFQASYEQVAAPLTAWAHLRCRGPLRRVIDPDDLVQEVVLEAWRAQERFDPTQGAFRSWMFGVANRVAAEALRRQARRAPALNLADEPVAELTTISRRVRRQEAMASLFQRMDELDADDRDVIVYRGIEGLDHRSVGDLLGITPEAAAKRWQRLREQIATWPVVKDLLSDRA